MNACVYGVPSKLILYIRVHDHKSLKKMLFRKKILKESAIHRNRWYNLEDYILERICKQRNCLKSIYSINYRYFKFTKFALESAWGGRHVFTPVNHLLTSIFWSVNHAQGALVS